MWQAGKVSIARRRGPLWVKSTFNHALIPSLVPRYLPPLRHRSSGSSLSDDPPTPIVALIQVAAMEILRL
jgi:hypothetical protein